MFIKIVDAQTGQNHIYEGKKVRWMQAEMAPFSDPADSRTYVGHFPESADKVVGLYISIDEKEHLSVFDSAVYFMAETGKTIDRWCPPNGVILSE